MSKFKCDNGLSLEECELTILRLAVDKADENIKKKILNRLKLKK